MLFRSIFPKPPLVAFNIPQSLGAKLIRAKLPPAHDRPKRFLKGMQMCGRTSCLTCSYVKEQKVVRSTSGQHSVQISGAFNCNSSNIVYMLQCEKCSMQYVGESQATLNQRFLQHRGYVRNKELDKVTGEHFNKPGHDMSDMKI